MDMAEAEQPDRLARRPTIGDISQLTASDRAWTVVRPVFLQDEQGTGRVRLAEQPLRGEVPREDVAGVLAAVLHEPRSARRVLYVSAGDDPIDEALARVL